MSAILGWDLDGFTNAIGSGVRSFGRGFGTMLGQTYNPNLATRELFATKEMGINPADLTWDERLQLDKAYDNALARQQQANMDALAPWALGLKGLGAVANWWGMNRQSNLMESMLKNQLKIQKANFNNAAQLLDERRDVQARNRANWSGTAYVAPTPLERV